jgi:hypothetical protein
MYFDLLNGHKEDINHLTRTIKSNEIEAVIESTNKEQPQTGWIHC